MLSKLLIDSLRENFYDKFDKLSGQSLYLKEAITDIEHHPGVKDLEESQRMDFEDNLYAVISSASVLGYYIGLQEGADIIQSLVSSDLPEKMLAAFGELVSNSCTPVSLRAHGGIFISAIVYMPCLSKCPYSPFTTFLICFSLIPYFLDSILAL